MAALRVLHIRSLDQLRDRAADWDDLWLRSDVALPTLRAELIAQWAEAFALRERLMALTIEDGGRMLAALPLVGSRVPPLPLRLGGLTANPWSPNGELLLDPECDVAAVARALAAELGRAPWPLLWLAEVQYEAPRWQALFAALEEAGLTVHCRPDYRVGQVDVGPSWSAFEAAWSGNHRRHLRKVLKRMDRDGGSQLHDWSALPAEELPDAVRRAFEIEDRSWKGAAGTSVVRSPGMLDFFTRQAAQLAAWGQLDLAVLEHAGGDIAFSFGYRAKGVSFYHKVGYDESRAHYSPGQAMLHHRLRAFHEAGEPRLLDFVGPLQDWTSKWATRTYGIGRAVIAPRRLSSRLLMHGYTRWWPRLAALRNAWRERRAGRHGAAPEQLAPPAEAPAEEDVLSPTA